MPRYSNYDEWLTDLIKDPVGELWLGKLRFDIRKANLPASAEKTFTQAVDANLRNIEPLLTAVSVIDFVLRSDPDAFDLKSQHRLPGIEEFSCIVKLEVYGLYLLNRRVFSTVVDDGEDDMDFIWENLGTLINSTFHAGALRTERKFFWCSPTHRLESLEVGRLPNQTATIMRTRLGLSHMPKGQRIVRLDIPPRALVGKRVRAPTSLDGGANAVFVPAHQKDGFGRAVNLKTAKRDLKEVVVEEIVFTPAVHAKKQGRIGSRCPRIELAAIARLVI
jgi:hypothetical protein